MTRKFTSLDQIEAYLKTDNIRSLVFRDERIRRVLAAEMSEAVHKVVYAKYTPSQFYKRRKDDGGLSDMSNMHITYVELEGAFLDEQIAVYFENLTMGQRIMLPIYGNSKDSLDGQFITDTIVEGDKDNWYSPEERDMHQRVVSDPRDFIAETIKNINANPTPLINAIKQAYKKIGFDIG